MRTRNFTLLLLILFVIHPFSQQAQDDSESQAYWVHEDPVYPAKVSDFEEYSSTLAENCKKYDIKEANWFTISTNDLKYFSISPIENMADLDKSRFSLLRDKMGDTEFNELFDNFDNCYDAHTDYIIHLDKDLSYSPDGIVTPQDGMEYRRMQFYYSTPQNFQKVLDVAKRFKELYVSKESKESYRLYRSGFGAAGQFIIVAISAKSSEDYARIFKVNQDLLGEERDLLFNDLMKNIIKVETLDGYMRSDLSYKPSE
ncbi:MAG: hypothetical protein ACI83B_002188 [Sediminicola sp.]|jgi:hypothetical protein|tara:strand:+ start:6703 stop:7473 length:771 start_codon:yes stop_codon:yes gene_type:complete